MDDYELKGRVDDDELKGRMNDGELKGRMDGRIIYKVLRNAIILYIKK